MSNVFLQIPTKGDPTIIQNFRILNEFIKKVAEQGDVLKAIDTTVAPGSTVMISYNDKKADYLANKLVASTGITLTQNHDGSVEDMSIAADDKKASVSANDTTPGYLNGKLLAGSNISLTEGSDAGDETLTIASTAAGVSGSILEIQVFCG